MINKNDYYALLEEGLRFVGNYDDWEMAEEATTEKFGIPIWLIDGEEATSWLNELNKG